MALFEVRRLTRRHCARGLQALILARVSSTISLNDLGHRETIGTEIERLRLALQDSRSTQLLLLFDYLVARSREGSTASEMDIAQDVFGRREALDEANSRVYVYRLRKWLDRHYQTNPPGQIKIELARGKYRLVALLIASSKSPVTAELIPLPGYVQPFLQSLAPVLRMLKMYRWQTTFLGCGLASVAILLAVNWTKRVSSFDNTPADSEFWKPLLTNGRALRLIEGDVSNSGLIPFGISVAQQTLEPILSHAKELRIVRASQMSTISLPPENNIYIGLNKNLGMFSQRLFTGSKYGLLENGAGLIDRGKNIIYASSDPAEHNLSPVRQFGLISVFPGPLQNRYLIMSATDEMALIGITSASLDPGLLSRFQPYARDGGSFEALMEVDGQDGHVFATKIVSIYQRDSRQIYAVKQ